MNIRGKNLTNSAKVLGATIALSGLVLKAFGALPESMSIDDFIKVGAFVTGIFATVDVSLWIRNLVGPKDTPL